MTFNLLTCVAGHKFLNIFSFPDTLLSYVLFKMQNSPHLDVERVVKE